MTTGGGEAIRAGWRTQGDRPRLRWSARALLAFVAASTGCTAALVVLAVLTASHSDGRRAQFSPADVLIAGAVAVAFSVAVAIIARSRRGVGWPRNLATRSLPVPAHIRSRIDALAVAVGVTGPDIVILESEAINATVSGRGDRARVILTSGACDIEDPQLDAITAYCMAIIADEELGDVQAATVAVTCYAGLVKLFAGALFVSFWIAAFSPHSAPWVAVEAASALAVLVVAVVGTMATAAVVTMSGAAGELADSRAAALTMQPEAYAILLVGMARQPAFTRSSTSPLVWLEHTTTRDDMVAVFGMRHSQAQIERRAARMCAVAGFHAPEHWT